MENPSQSTSQGPSQSISQGPSQSKSKSKTRGPTTCKKFIKKKKVDEVITVEFDEFGRAIGEYGKKFKSYIGTSVRCHVDINISNWHKVDQGLKDTIWDEVKREFNFQDDMKKQMVLRAAGKRWKDFKNRLVREFIKKKHSRYASPTELYEFLNDEQWERFVAERGTKEFKEKSEKGREKQLLNEHPHYLGNVGYAGKRPRWLISDPLSSQSSCSSISSALTSNDRSLDWVRARSKKGDDGNFYIPNEKTASVVQKIVEKVEELGQGSFQTTRQHDVLSTVLYKKKGDLSGYVRGVGSYLNVREVFGKPEKARERVSGVVSVDDIREIIKKEVYSDIAAKVKLDITEQVRQNTLLEVQPKIDMLTHQLSLVVKSMPQQFPQQFPNDVRSSAVGTPQSVEMPAEPLVNTHSSCHSVDSYPFGMIQSPISCRLAVFDIGDSSTEVVASGTLYPSGPDTIVHSQPLLPHHVKVSVDMLLPGATTTLSIPVPTGFHTTVAEIVGSFAQWPLHLVNIEEEEIIKNSAIKKNEGKKQSDDQCDMSATGVRSPFIDDDGLQPLGKCGKRLHNLIRRMPLDLEYFELKLDYDIFHHKNMNNIFVMIEDIKDLFTMDWLDVSIIQVFELYAHQLCKDFEVNSIGFMCPTQFAKRNVDLNEDAVTAYIGNSMVTLKDKTFIIAPYHQVNHWLLLVLHESSRTVYVLDPMNCMRKIEVKQAMNMAFRTSAIQRGQRIMGNAIWKYVKCPQQPGSVECGYYVMRFIYDICTKFHDYTSLDEVYQDTNAYSKDEMDEIRRLWIDYFVNECI